MSDSDDFNSENIPIAAPAAIADFIDKWAKSGGYERSNCQLFLSELARLLDETEPIPAQEEQPVADLSGPLDIVVGKLNWPAKLPEQMRLARTTLVGEAAPIDSKALSRRFTGGRKRDTRITELLDTLTDVGEVQQDGERYFLPRD